MMDCQVMGVSVVMPAYNARKCPARVIYASGSETS